MTAKSENRGNEIEYKNGDWGIMAEHEKCCACGQLPDERGYDSCLVDLIDGLNLINGVETKESCCGHGKRESWIWFTAENKKAIFDAIGFLNPSFENGDRIETEIKCNNIVYVACLNRKDCHA